MMSGEEPIDKNLLDNNSRSDYVAMDDVVLSRTESKDNAAPRQSSVAKEPKKTIKPPPSQDPEEGRFYARHNHDINFDLSTPADKRYFDLAGHRRPQQINVAGISLVSEFHDDMEIPIDKMPVDDGLARVDRIKTFEKAAYERVLEAEDGFDNYDHALQPGEEIVFDFDCTEISDFPATTEHINIYGTTRISLVKNAKTDEYRLFFSIREGLSEIFVGESFYQCGAQPTCLFCCIDCQIPCVEQFRKIKTSMTAQFESNTYMNSQFFTMPISSILVDSVCYRAQDNEYAATHTPEKGHGHKGCCDDIKCCDCCVTCPKIPECCALKQARDIKSVRFQAYERFHLGGDDPKYSAVVKQPTKDGVWSVNATNDDVNYIVLHYRSLLDHKNHSCKMRLARTDKPTEQFHKAQKFVSILGHSRDKKLAEFFAGSSGYYGNRFDAIRSTQPQTARFIVEADYSNVPPHVLGCATCLSTTFFCVYNKRDTIEAIMNTIDNVAKSSFVTSASRLLSRFSY